MVQVCINNQNLIYLVIQFKIQVFNIKILNQLSEKVDFKLIKLIKIKINNFFQV